MIETFIQQMAAQGREASLVLYLLATLVILGTALHREWLVLGKTAKRDRESATAKDKALVDVNAKLVEQRILNERATVTLEMQHDRIRELELDLAREEGKPRQRPRERQRE